MQNYGTIVFKSMSNAAGKLVWSTAACGERCLVIWAHTHTRCAELRRYAMLSMNSILFAASSNPSEFGLPPVGLPSVANNHSMVMHSSQYCCRQCREPMWNSESGREALFDRTISLKELRCACHCWLVNCAMCKDPSCVECYCTVTLNGPVRHLQCNFQVLTGNKMYEKCVCVCTMATMQSL